MVSAAEGKRLRSPVRRLRRRARVRPAAPTAADGGPSSSGADDDAARHDFCWWLGSVGGDWDSRRRLSVRLSRSPWRRGAREHLSANIRHLERDVAVEPGDWWGLYEKERHLHRFLELALEKRGCLVSWQEDAGKQWRRANVGLLDAASTLGSERRLTGQLVLERLTREVVRYDAFRRLVTAVRQGVQYAVERRAALLEQGALVPSDVHRWSGTPAPRRPRAVLHLSRRLARGRR